VLLRILQAKFADNPDAARARIDGADSRTLVTWSERVLTATDIEQVIDEEESG
jgi:hypothetical protein